MPVPMTQPQAGSPLTYETLRTGCAKPGFGHRLPVADLLTAARSYGFKRDAKRRDGRTHPLLAWWRTMWR